MAVPKVRAGNTMTESAYRSFIKSGLRQKSRRWPPIYQAMEDAYVGKKINKSTGRLAKHYACADCGEHFPAKEVVVDHIHPVVRLSGFISWDDVIDRLFVEKDGLQVLDNVCHHYKTQAERALARELAKNQEEAALFEALDDEGQYTVLLERIVRLKKETQLD